MKRLAALFALFIILIIVLADMGKLGILGFLNRVPFGDKAGHFILYGILTLLLDLAIIQARPNSSRRLIVLRIALILALITGLEEVSQKFFASRTFSLLDLIFSYLGVAFFSWLALRIKQ